MNFSLLLLFCIFLFFSPLMGNAQTLLNGDFENNTATGCTYNLENEDFNETMPHVFAFGNNSEMDIHTDGCGYAPLISNDWFVSLSQRPGGEVDALSLETDSPLSAGTTYRLSWFDWAETSGINNIPLPLQIGLSTDTFDFGEMISASLPLAQEWTLRMVEFAAPNNGRFITLRMAGNPGLKGWTFVDNFKLTPLTYIFENNKKDDLHIFPNPTADWLHLEAGFSIQCARLYDETGRVVKSFWPTGGSDFRFDLRGLKAGVYFLKIIKGDAVFFERVVKI